jgi:APA family basic amino acid/polyamine antiporter
VIGVGAMLGAGIFAALAPAAAAAGSGILLALVVAAVVALCNATSAAQLAAVHPQSGGAYVYGRARLGAWVGFVAGWGFVVGKVASCAAMALTFGTYLSPTRSRPLALAAVLALAFVDSRGVEKTAGLTRALVSVVVLALATMVAAVWLGGAPRTEHLRPLAGAGLYGVLQAAGLLFFAFAGFARIATLGEEIVDPARTIPRAIPVALGVVLLVYAGVAVSALAVLGPERLAAAPAPLAAAVEATSRPELAAVIRIGAAVASLGVLLSLLVGVSRTVFAMAADAELPGWLAAVHPRTRVPHRAGVAVALAVGTTVLVADLGGAIGFSACTVLVYYAITNAAALRLASAERRWPRALAGGGLVGCVLLALTLPAPAVLSGFAVLAAGLAARAGLRASRAGCSR